MELEKRPKTNRADRKKDATRQKIVAVTLELFQKNGIEATTMEQIAEAADVAKGTLYHYFPVKEAIISQFIQGSFQMRFAERAAALKKLPGTRERVRLVLGELITGIQSQPELFEKYFVYRIRQMIAMRPEANDTAGLNQLGLEIIQLGQEEGEIRREIPQDMLEGFFEFIFIEVAQMYYKAPAQFKAAETIDNCVDLFLHGVKPKE